MGATAAGELFHRCLTARRSEDWREFVDRFEPRVRSRLRRLMRRLGLPAPAHEVDELVQDFFYRLLLKASRCGGAAQVHSEIDVWAYLSQMAHNLVIDLLRSRTTAKHRLLAGRRGWRLAPRCRWLELVSDEPSPEQAMLDKERRTSFLEDCLLVSQGPAAALQTEALRLAVFEGWSSFEIADALGGPKPAEIDYLVYRLRRLLAAKHGVVLPRRNAVAV